MLEKKIYFLTSNTRDFTATLCKAYVTVRRSIDLLPFYLLLLAFQLSYYCCVLVSLLVDYISAPKYGSLGIVSSVSASE